MSSTNRSMVRNEADYYRTPVIEIERFLIEFNKLYGYHLNYGNILDPCAGGDEEHTMSYPEAIKAYNNDITTIDIREDSRADIKADYLETDCFGKYDLIITNPPFCIALDIIKKALDDVKDGGLVVMLLRLNYYGSKDRKPFWNNFMPEHCFVHHKRIGFTDNGKTDSIEYCHMVWRKSYYPDYTKLKVI
ncbi:hypothetical protein LY28_01334 [Ruminiclostridium sufflavum DSM 19573]|uniref:Uncharacterized protein n=1 Tax=Ruminiclostridium sufflavum DSM 19573 TaxID=1121337 RepID=A0A318XQI3_9FIRM|nr:hypothetical protein [Ruminiclostridium sufflavum]PYG88485.1 hypothetical protein LY28_01334 [Ruminiclostridium sufflavum DSM 19573]